MVSRHPFLAALYALCIWIVKYAAGSSCSDPRTTAVNGSCCKMCPPGQYLEDFCTKTTETVCRPCPDKFFSEQYNAFNKCTPCQSCQGAHRDYEKKCSPTANAKCSCRPGFLCSDDACSKCLENTCDVGEMAVRTGPKQFKCQPCRDHEYLDVKMNNCTPRTQCSSQGLVVTFPGNKTHDALCGVRETNPLFVYLGVGCAVLALVLLVILSHVGRNVAKNCRADPHLSIMEETGQQLMIQTDSKTKPQEIVTTLS
ncbi:tumor necrosis factor receptor superfamily member 18 [Festucalex cinctus]